VDVATAVAKAATKAGRPAVVHTMYWGGDAAAALRSGGVPVYRDIEAAIAALRLLHQRSHAEPTGVPEVPTAKAGPRPDAGDYWGARALLAEAGIEFAEAARADDARVALEAAESLGYPVAVKALGLVHKSDSGGVALGIASREELESELSRMATFATGYSVERMASVADGVEVIVGALQDLRFGPVVVVGLGGVFAELLDDIAVALAPVSSAQALGLLESLRGASALQGVRGRPAVDLEAAARATATLSELAAARPDLAELEINPLLVTPDGAVALDARVVSGENGADAR